MSEFSRVAVAITGALSQPRAAIATLIDATSNGRFVESVTFDTHYLVCTKQDSQKAKKAARLGTTVISEEELMEYLATGRFPLTELPKMPSFSGLSNFPEIDWEPKGIPKLCLLSYCDRLGRSTMRQIVVTQKGISNDGSGKRWIGGYDGPAFKTWREDRIVELEELRPWT